eukprot:m.69556 g.69556  ORF g.69556 m.69556 type:complete len:179 (-) comp16029_c0_seq2:244-780(-)
MAQSNSSNASGTVSRSARLGQKRAALGTDLRNQVKNSFELLLSNFTAMLQAGQFKIRNENAEENDDVMENLMASASATHSASRNETEGNIPFTTDIQRDEYAMGVCANNMVKASEQLLAVAARLKRVLAISNDQMVNAQIAEQQRALSSEQERLWALLGQFRDELNEHVGALNDQCAE